MMAAKNPAGQASTDNANVKIQMTRPGPLLPKSAPIMTST